MNMTDLLTRRQLLMAGSLGAAAWLVPGVSLMPGPTSAFGWVSTIKAGWPFAVLTTAMRSRI